MAYELSHGVQSSEAHRFSSAGRGLRSCSIYENARMNNSALEKHYRVRELAALWGFSDNTIIRIFTSEPGVIRLESGAGKRKYTTLSIPEGVALRVHERLSQEALKAHLSAG